MEMSTEVRTVGRRRALKNVVLVSIGESCYQLLDHPEVEIHRYHGGHGNRAFRAWTIFFKGNIVGNAGQHYWSASDFEDLDRQLLRFGNCQDCGVYCFRQGHPRTHCSKCLHPHEELKRKLEGAARAAEEAGQRWDRAGELVELVLGEFKSYVGAAVKERLAAQRAMFEALRRC